MMVEFLLPILIGVASSFISSFLFLKFMLKQEPKIEISNEIAIVDRARNGQLQYEIKIINRTRKDLVNVRVELNHVKSIGIPGGRMYYRDKIGLMHENFFQIKKYSKADEKGLYALRLICEENLDEIWEANQMITLKIIATHSQSGFSKCFEKDFNHKESCLVFGEFHFGDDMKIKRLER